MVKKRINRCIELLEQGEILYCSVVGELTYENGLEQSKTWADFLITDFEHYSFDITALTNFMRGLVDGGPTRSGHRTPAVIVEAPVDGESEQTIRANSWQFRQILH